MFMEQFEETVPALGEFPSPEAFPLPELPKLSELFPKIGESTSEVSSTESLGEVKTVEVEETPKKSRVGIEILEA